MNDKFRILYIVYTKDTHLVHDVVTEFSESIDDEDLQDFYTLFENKCERSGVQLCAIIPQGEAENPNVFVNISAVAFCSAFKRCGALPVLASFQPLMFGFGRSASPKLVRICKTSTGCSAMYVSASFSVLKPVFKANQ